MIETFQSERTKASVSALLDPESMGTVLYMVALDRFGAAIHEWEPEMLDMEFRDEFGIDVPPANHAKLLAVATSLSSNSFYTDPRVFGSVCEVLSGGADSISPFPPQAMPGELAWGLTEILLLDESPGPVSSDVAAYCGVILDGAGFVSPHPRLPFAKMPFVYRGSSPDYVHGENEATETENSAAVDQFLSDQASTMLDQIERLPFVDEDLVEAMANDAARLDFRIRVEQGLPPR